MAALQRPERATRGKRLSKLLDEEAEADDEFWSQEAFKEEDGDTDFEAEGNESSDDFDSDFDDKEPSSDEGGPAEDEDRDWSKKRKIFPGRVPTPAQKKSKKKGISILELTSLGRASEATLAAPKPARPPRPKQAPPELLESSKEVTIDLDGEKTKVRKSTRKAVIVKQAMREAQRVAMEAFAKPVKKKEHKEERKMSQEEMLLEAAKTEVLNRKTLEIMLAREEEVKKKATITKAVYSGPQIRFHSKDGRNTIEFTQVDEFPEVFDPDAAEPYPKRSVCAITGLPAKYQDPHSGLPYATKEAFQQIRERYCRGDGHPYQRKRTKVEREYAIPGKAGVVKVKYKRNTTPSVPGEGTTHASNGEHRGNRSTTAAVATSVPSLPPVIPGATTGAAPESAPNFASSSATAGVSMDRAPQPEPEPLPRPMIEANEADFMLEDLEVSLPSNLDTGLCSLSLSAPSSMLQGEGMSRGQQGSHMHLQHEILDLHEAGQELLQPDLLCMDDFGSLL